MWAKHKQSGFTIVELLIVIVVIAILAAITIVSYNGIQNSSRSAKMLAAIDAYTKGAQMYKAANGRFPNPTPGTDVYDCLGSYPAQGVFGVNSCVNGGGSDAVFSNSTLNAQFASVMGNLPSVSDISLKMGTTNIRGIQYIVTDEDTGNYFVYYVSGINQKCGRGQAQNDPSNDATECKVYLD